MTNKKAIEALELQNRINIRGSVYYKATELAIEELKRQKVGTWKPYGKSLDGIYLLWKCSVCGNTILSEDEQDRTIFHKYCGFCGAKMEDENAVIS